MYYKAARLGRQQREAEGRGTDPKERERVLLVIRNEAEDKMRGIRPKNGEEPREEEDLASRLNQAEVRS